MSQKYQRVKQADLLLPAPLRWLTRAFSSITLAVILLVLVAVYGMVASVPIAFLAEGGLYLAAIAAPLAVATLASAMARRRRPDPPTWPTALARAAGAQTLAMLGAGVVIALALMLKSKLLDSLAISPAAGTYSLAAGLMAIVLALVYSLLTGVMGRDHRQTLGALLVTAGMWALAVAGVHAAGLFADAHAFFATHRATIIYRLPAFEMTELQFYNWWPFKLLLGLFVINLVWATLRRIEFSFLNLGVLSVHTGIVTIAVATIFYAAFKVEGDTLVWRKDLGGQPVHAFYDKHDPAVYFALDGKMFFVPLNHGPFRLPRYNDYPPGSLNIRLHDDPIFQQVMGPGVRATIRGFISYGRLEPVWTEAPSPSAADANPALRLLPGDAERPQLSAEPQILLAAIPARRVFEQDTWAVEYLVGADPRRLADLQTPFAGSHGLIVEIPAANFRAVYSIAPDQTIVVGDTGYTLHIEAIGDYGLAFVTPGYEGARDTRATVRVQHADRTFRRMVMHRYPERSQDFIPAPNDPAVGPMGRRTPPDPAVKLTYLDASKLQYRILADNPDDPHLKLMVRLPGQDTLVVPLPNQRFPIGGDASDPTFVHIVDRFRSAIQVPVPAVVPKSQRVPKDEGTFLHALVPLDLEVDQPDGSVFKHTLWLTHMRYPDWPDPTHRPAMVSLPALGPVRVMFSRVRFPLPFSITLDAFDMQPYPGTQIPRDFVADLTLQPLDPAGTPTGPPTPGKTRLNNPLIHHGIKLSQVGWDPGDNQDPARMARNEQGRFTNQQRYSILGVGNNVGIRVIFAGSCLIALGIPWAFYVKPALVRRRKTQFQRQLAAAAPAPPSPTSSTPPAPSRDPVRW